jgi:RNA polymerase II subunit A small phosphatase-like protein
LQKPEHAGRLTVVLDLDGTLLSSYTPRRAPVLPAGSIAYIVGRGGRLNPNGVFVVERPGLRTFLRNLSNFAGRPRLASCVRWEAPLLAFRQALHLDNVSA